MSGTSAGSTDERRLVPPFDPARHLVFWVVVVVAGAVVVSGVIQAVTADPREGEDWVGGAVEAVLAGGPLLLVASGLRSGRKATAKRTAVASLLFALVVAFVLVMQLLDPNENTPDRLIQGLALLVYLVAFSVELPAFGDRWPPDAPPQR